MHFTLPNAVHAFGPKGPTKDPFLYAAVLEMAVNRTRGRVTGAVWSQPQGTTWITGVYFHMLPVTKAFERGYRGWLQIYGTVFDKMGCHWLSEYSGTTADLDPAS